MKSRSFWYISSRWFFARHWQKTLLSLYLLGCSSPSSTPPLPELPLPECDGASLDHVCQSYAFVASSTYGVALSCSTSPFLKSPDGSVMYRAEGLEGCIEVGSPGPSARCCP